MKKNNLDFIVAGIQKSGTTMLAQYLSQNNKLFIPPEKEVPFFLNKEINENDWKSFLTNYFYKGKDHQLWGTVSPQYMMYPNSLKKIYKKFPKIKIIIIYREPISRFISHYDMSVRFNNEQRNLNSVIKEQIKNIKKLRKNDNKNYKDKYITSGEYSRLNKHLKIFPKRNILKIDYQEFILKPKIVLNKISIFLKINNKFKLSKKIIMKGGKKRIININHDRILRVFKSFLQIIKIYKFLPKKLIKNVYIFSYWLDQINTNVNSKSNIKDINVNELKMLKKHYKDDILEYLKISKKK